MNTDDDLPPPKPTRLPPLMWGVGAFLLVAVFVFALRGLF